MKDIFVINVDDPAEEYPDLNSVWRRFQSVMVITGSAASHVAAFTDYMTKAFEVSFVIVSIFFIKHLLR